MTETTPTYCANHPNVETVLRCRTCDKYICVKCAVRTPTGYRCKECVRGQQKIFDTARWYDYLGGFLVAGVLSGLASFLILLVAGFIGFFAFFIVFLASPAAGGLIAEVVRRVTGRRRARGLFLTIIAGAALGALPMLIAQLLIFDIFGIIFQGIYLFTALPTLYYRLSGIQLFK